MNVLKSLSHSRWACKYHVVFVPKGRKKALYGRIRKYLKTVFHELARQRSCEIVEGHMVGDHVHMCISIPPNYVVSEVIGYLKGKSAIAIARQFGGRQKNFSGERFFGLVAKEPPGYSSKLEKLKELLETLNVEKDRKIVLFSEWTTMLGLIEAILKKLKMDYVRLDGSVPQKKRAQLVHTFRSDPSCKLFMTTNAGSTGLNLQAANTVINVDLPWNPAVLEQRIARAHRMGQKNPVQVYILVTEQTIEEGMLGTLAAKKEVALAALDINSKVKSVDMAGGAEAMKRRLEILLGRPEDAPLDVSELQRQKQAVETTARKEKIAVAAGELFSSAFKLLGEIIPQQSDEAVAQQKIESIRTHLSECLETNEQGQVELKLKLPNKAALKNIAVTLAKLMG